MDDRWKRWEAISQAERRLEAATLAQDFSQVDYRDVALLLSEMRHYRQEGYVALHIARRAVLSMVRARYPDDVAAFERVRGWETFEPWCDDFVDTLLGKAEEAIASPFHRGVGRVLCPLCGEGPEQVWTEQGWSVPEGLRRHLTGYGRVSQCSVMVVLGAITREHWSRA